MRRLLGVSLAAVSLGLGLAAGWRLLERRPAPVPDPPAVVQRVREVARLEALDLSLYKKISFAPDPQPRESLWGEVVSWVRYSVRAPQGKAIVFAEAHVGLDLEKLSAERVRVSGRRVAMVLPPLKVTVELKPGETEVIGSNLDSAQTAQLFELAKSAFEREVSADPQLRAKARGAAERAIRGLLLPLGFEQVDFVDRLPGDA